MEKSPHNNEKINKKQDVLNIIGKLPEKLRNVINNANEKIRGILEQVLANPAEVAISAIKLPIRYKLFLLLAIGYLIDKETKSQTNPDYPAGYNHLKLEIYNALPQGNVMNTYADQVRYTEDALDNSYQNRCLTMTGIMHEGFDDSNITVQGDLGQTWLNFYNNFLSPNNMPNDVTYVLQSTCDAGGNYANSTMGEAYAQEQNYIIFAVNAIDENNPNYATERLGHEVSHSWGENNADHTKGNEPVNYQTNYGGTWYDLDDGKSLCAAGSGTNLRLGAYTTSATDAVTDADGWVTIPDPTPDGFPSRVHKSELVNTSGAGNTNDGIANFIQNNPDRIYNIPLTGEYASHVPVAPSFNLNGNLLSIANQGGYNKQFEIFNNSGENIDVDYEWYIYHTSNAADGNQINSIGFKMDEVVDLDALGIAGDDLSIAVLSIDGNTLSPFTQLPSEDTENPEAVCQTATVELGTNGQATITPEMVDGGSTDNVGIVNMTVTPNSVDCDDTGNVDVTLTVEDAAGNTDQCTTTVTVEDNLAPEAIGQNLTLNITDGPVTITAADVNNGSSDNCSIDNMTLSQYTFDSEGVFDVVLTVVDEAGNSDNTTVQVTAIISDDTNPPTAICQNATVELDENGEAAITPEMIDNGSWDAEGGVSLSVNPTNVDCDDTGNVSVTLTVTDDAGNTDQCTATVTVYDNASPEMVGQNIEIDLAQTAPNPYFITPEDVDNGSSDNCEIVEMTVSPDNFEHTGVYTVTLTGVDDAGNESETDVQVTAIRSVGIDDNENFAGIRMFPNPTDGIVKIESGKSIQQIQVFNASGKSMMVYQAPKNTYQAFKDSHEFNTENWAPGIYMVQIKLENGDWETKKLIVK